MKKSKKDSIEKKLKKIDKDFFEVDDNNHLSFYELFWIFMICNVIGYCVEMVFGRVTNGYWESRQSLIYGPFGLAYGIGGSLLSLLLKDDLHKAWWKTFIKSFLVGTVAEYIFSLGEELLFGHVSWDYSALPLNINGRVCLLYSIFWGILGLVWAKFIYPGFIRMIDKLPLKIGKPLFWVVFLLIFADIVCSCEAVARKEARASDIPPANRFEEFMDEHWNDDFLNKVYANAQIVE